jgi:hypothetical protein
MINDPALGSNKAVRAFGKNAPKRALDATVAKKATTGVNTKKAPVSKKQVNKAKDKRVNKLGMFDGPRPSYGKYNVSEQASDILNRSINKKGTK